MVRGRTDADHPPRSPAHVREPSHRRRRQLKGGEHIYGHASITITLDRYGHLMPGNEAEAADLLDGYLARQREGQARSCRPPSRRSLRAILPGEQNVVVSAGQWRELLDRPTRYAMRLRRPIRPRARTVWMSVRCWRTRTRLSSFRRHPLAGRGSTSRDPRRPANVATSTTLWRSRCRGSSPA